MALNNSTSPSNSLVQNLRQQLMRVLPFSKMMSADVNYFLRYSIEAYFAPDEIILPPADGMPKNLSKNLYLIRHVNYSCVFGAVLKKRLEAFRS